MEAPQEEKEESGNTEPGPMKMAAAPKEETKQEEEEAVEEETPAMVEEANEEETTEKKSTSEAPTKQVVSKQNDTKQKKVQSKETVKPKLEKVMAKIDAKIKNPVKNLQLKNLIKMDAMVDDQISLDSYNVAFYAPKDIYLDQLDIFDSRQIYPNTNLASYIQSDKIEIKAKKLNEINIKKQKLLMELEMLKNG